MTRTSLTPVTIVVLWPDEIALLNRQHPSTRGRGGFQCLLVDLASRVNSATGQLSLSVRDLGKDCQIFIRLRKRRLGAPPEEYLRTLARPGTRPNPDTSGSRANRRNRWWPA